MLIDSHCHLHDKEFFSAEQAEAMLTRARENDVQKIICIGTSHEDSLVAREFATSHDDVYWTYGIHPSKADSTNVAHEFDLVTNRPIAIGEVGLDYHYEGYSRKAQIKLFESMLQLAQDNNLPVSFHVREAFNDFFPITANFPTVRGVVHSFTDNKKNLQKILNETDYYVGVNGMATYSTLPTPPIERILLETDAPFLAPVPHRGTKNEPSFVRDVAIWLSKKTGVNFEDVCAKTTNNAIKLFGVNLQK